MDHSDKMKQNLEALWLESFDGLSLAQLSDSMGKNLPCDMGSKRILEIYVMWLHHRLMAIDVSAEDDFTHEIATWYRFVKVLPNDDRNIAEAFHDWQRDQAFENPASSRRLSIAEAELRGLMAAAPKDSEPSTSSSKPEGRDSAKSEARYGQMHPDRARLSQNSPIVIDDDEDDDDDIVEISSNTFKKGRASPRGLGRNGQSDLSFLTGSNMLPMNGKTRFPRGKGDIEAPKPKGKPAPKPESKSAPKPDGKPMPKPEGKPVAKPSDSHSARPGKKGAGVPKKLPGDYVCDRCRKKGHFFKDCPTSMDPAFDRKPPRAYTCHICKKKGEHHVTLCPMNEDPLSLTQRRRGYEKKHGLAGENRRAEDRDGYRDDRQPRARDRSRSPGRDAGRRVHTDRYRPLVNKYRPLEEFSRLRVSADRTQPRKRRASPSRSPSPDRTAPRKKSQAWVSEGAKNWSAMAFADNLMIRQRDPAEGRLSYDDVPQSSPTKHSASSSVVGGMDVEVPEKAASEKSEDDSHADHNQLLELDVLEMIRIESVKTDLLLLVGGVERLPLSVPFLDKFFKGQESVWVNEALTKTRPCSTDFYAFRIEDEQQIETIDCEMIAEMEAAEGVEQLCVSGNEEDWEMMTLEPAHSVTGDEGDAVMADAEPTGVDSADEENLAISIITERLDEDVVVEAPVFVIQAAAHEATDVEGAGSSSPYIVDDTSMEVEATPATAEDSAAASDKPVDPVGCGVDSEMADVEPFPVTKDMTAGCQEGGQEVIVIESSQPTESSQPNQATVAASPSHVVEE
ncbi:hypothetical protein C8A01DRAFT_34802 [Parachaetomium inaequale]|uniref:CCHC-type domain-containing protein n=1 Tax=Parachaetomium inaequale TaxID=2588326 RepID=A0AAN6ST86_9PEZI|nr:hypothetical protein C8A01DRAFT_34802 [Parachaetomium inaequale]